MDRLEYEEPKKKQAPDDDTKAVLLRYHEDEFE
jgi:hypothetical protein